MLENRVEALVGKLEHGSFRQGPDSLAQPFDGEVNVERPGWRDLFDGARADCHDDLTLTLSPGPSSCPALATLPCGPSASRDPHGPRRGRAGRGHLLYARMRLQSACRSLRRVGGAEVLRERRIVVAQLQARDEAQPGERVCRFDDAAQGLVHAVA